MNGKHYRELWHQQIKATEQLQAELDRKKKGSRLLEQTIEDQKNTYVGSKKCWEDKIKQLQEELAVEKHEYEMLRQGFNALDSDIANLQADNVLLREALNDQSTLCDEGMSLDNPYLLISKRQALNSTPQTAKIQAVLDAAKEQVTNHNHFSSNPYGCKCPVCVAVREMEE